MNPQRNAARFLAGVLVVGAAAVGAFAPAQASTKSSEQNSVSTVQVSILLDTGWD